MEVDWDTAASKISLDFKTEKKLWKMRLPRLPRYLLWISGQKSFEILTCWPKKFQRFLADDPGSWPKICVILFNVTLEDHVLDFEN